MAQCAITNETCAKAAFFEASQECEESGRFLKRGSFAWQWIGFSLVLASAAFTGVGASTTIANAKIYSTLGGTTALGAVTTTVNSNVTADQNAVASVSGVLDSLNTAVTGAMDAQNYDQVLIIARTAGAKCALAATSSSGTTASQAAPPGAPTIGVATPGNGQVSVAFTAPANTGGAPITSYTVVAKPGRANASGAVSPITVTGLNNGTPYTFTVTATNAIGVGPASAPSNAVTPQP